MIGDVLWQTGHVVPRVAQIIEASALGFWCVICRASARGSFAEMG